MLHLLTHTVLRDQAVDITTYIVPEEIFPKPAQGLGFAHVTTQWCGVEFLQEHGDKGVVERKPKLVAIANPICREGIIRMSRGILVNLLLQFVIC